MGQLFPSVSTKDKRDGPRPAPDRHINYRVFATHHVALCRQAVIDDEPMTPCFKVIAVDGIFFRLRGEVLEVERLAAVCANACGYKHQPRIHFSLVGGCIGRHKFANLLGEVNQHGIAVKDANVTVQHRRCFGIGVDGLESV